jgi:hypothetical protein
MKAHGRRLRKCNIPAKLIMDALQPFRENFKGGMIWEKRYHGVPHHHDFFIP